MFKLYAQAKGWHFEVVYLWVSRAHRGNGIGRNLMNALCLAADRVGVPLRLWAKPFRGAPLRSPFDLAAWYTQFGFAPVFEERRQQHYHKIRMYRE